MISTDDAIRLITRARVPADLFGGGRPGYRKLAVAVHPDTHPGNDAAEAAYKRLSELRASYERGEDTLIACGDIANLYREGPGQLAKMPRDPADSDLMRAEVHALGMLDSGAPGETRQYYPELVRTGRRKDPGTRMTRQVSVLRELEGFVTLEQVRAAYPDGIDPRDAAWMWRRLLFALGGARRAGLIHGAVVPSNILIHPAQHGLVLADWCYSGEGPRRKLTAAPSASTAFYPASALAGVSVGYGLDIEMAAACITHVIGQDIPRQFRAFARGCQFLGPEPDAWAVQDEFDSLIERLWGPRRFRPFAMPAAGTTAGRTP